MGSGLSATDRAGKSKSTERQSNAMLLIFVFSWVLLTIKEIESNTSLIL